MARIEKRRGEADHGGVQGPPALRLAIIVIARSAATKEFSGAIQWVRTGVADALDCFAARAARNDGWDYLVIHDIDARPAQVGIESRHRRRARRGVRPQDLLVNHAFQ